MTQENKHKALAVSALVLAALLLVLVFYKKGAPAVDKEIFNVPELSTVDRVTMVSSAGKVELSFNGAKWRVNERYPADDQLITVLFATLQQVEPRRPLSSSMRDSISSILKRDGVHISFYVGDREVKKFVAGGNETKTEAYFFDEQNGPYLMGIPGYKVYASGVFEVDEMGWRDKRIFNFNWRNFKKLTAQFTGMANQNFEIEYQGRGFDLVNAAPTDTTKLNDYLDAVSLLVAKQFIPSGHNVLYDSISKKQPAVVIEAMDLGDNVYRLELFSPVDNHQEVVGKLGEGGMVLFNRGQVEPIWRTKDYFRKSG